MLVKMLWQGDLVDFCLLLEVFREDDLVDRCAIFRLLLKALLDDHVEVFCDSLRDRIILLAADFLLKFIDVLGIIWILLSAHFIQDDAESPNVRRFCLVLVLPKLWRKIVRSTDFLHFFVFSLACFALVLSLLTNSFKPR